MSAAGPDAWITRTQLAAAAIVLASSMLWLGNAAFRDPAVPFLTDTGDPDWIGVHRPPDSNAILVDRDRVPVFTFIRAFDLESLPARPRLEARALREAQLELNGGLLVPPAPTASWREPWEIDLEGLLASGRNELRVRVENARGPALLQLRIEGDEGVVLETDAHWRVLDPRGRAQAAAIADDTRAHPQSFSVPASGALLVDRAGSLALLFALAALLPFALRRSLPEGSLHRLPQLVLGAATVFWVAVYATKSAGLPVVMGFDIVGHLFYVDFLLEHGALPLATDGWSTYHPPLFHALTAGLVAIFDLERESAASRWLYRLPTALAGLANVWAVWFVARRLFEGDPLRTSLAIGFAALLPMNVYMSAYVSNEPLHSALVSASLALACDLILRDDCPPVRVGALAVVLGLAILTKFTALIALPLVALAVSVAVVIAKPRSNGGRVPLAKGLGVGAALLGGAAAVGGWFYVRNFLHFGRFVVGNWDLPSNRVWWEQPGFHTLDYYTGFGQALRYPYFAGYHSFWDGVYSTFWGDGLASGMVRLATRHEAWSWDFMTIGYWLAFPATVLLLLGVARALRLCVRGPDLPRRIALSLLVAVLYATGFALLSITLELPYYAQAKAFYALSAIVPLSIVAALGLAWVPEALAGPRWTVARVVYAGWLGTLAMVLVLSFLG